MKATLVHIKSVKGHVQPEHITLAGAYGIGGFVPHGLAGLLMMLAYLSVGLLYTYHSFRA